MHGSTKLKFSGNFLATYRDSISAPSSRVRITYRSNPQGSKWPLRMEMIGCPETSLRNYHYSMRKVPEEGSSHNHISCNDHETHWHLQNLPSVLRQRGIESRTDKNDCVQQNSNMPVGMFIKGLENLFLWQRPFKRNDHSSNNSHDNKHYTSAVTNANRNTAVPVLTTTIISVINKQNRVQAVITSWMAIQRKSTEAIRLISSTRHF